MAAGFQLGRAPVGKQPVHQGEPAYQVKPGQLVAQAGDASPAGAAAEVDQRRCLYFWIGLASGVAGRLRAAGLQQGVEPVARLRRQPSVDRGIASFVMGAHRRTHDAGNTVGAGRLDPERPAPRFGLRGELAHVAGAGGHRVAQPNAEVLSVGNCRLAEAEQSTYLGPLPLERAVVGGGQQRRPAARRRHAEPVRQIRDSILVHLGRVARKRPRAR